MENFKPKNREELDNQLSGVESILGGKVGAESIRNSLLDMDINEIKEKYPREYTNYLSLLQTEAKILNFPDLDHNNEIPKITLLPTGARGNAFKINFSDSAHVIKPLESMPEKEIANIASNLGIGPKQFKSKEYFLHEEFIDGTPLLKLEQDKCTPDYMEKLGSKFGKAFKTLHENNILINDQILTDDLGKSHMIIDKAGEVRFVDFGASIDISDYPNISDESVISLIRTDPFMAFKMMNIDFSSEGQKKELIKGYKENILSEMKTKEDLLRKDIQLLNEGLFFLRDRLPNVDYFIQGINSIK